MQGGWSHTSKKRETLEASFRQNLGWEHRNYQDWVTYRIVSQTPFTEIFTLFPVDILNWKAKKNCFFDLCMYDHEDNICGKEILLYTIRLDHVFEIDNPLSIILSPKSQYHSWPKFLIHLSHKDFNVRSRPQKFNRWSLIINHLFWTLKKKKVKIRIKYSLTVPHVRIQGSPDLHVDRGSTINLTCVISHRCRAHVIFTYPTNWTNWTKWTNLTKMINFTDLTKPTWVCYHSARSHQHTSSGTTMTRLVSSQYDICEKFKYLCKFEIFVNIRIL